MVQETQLNSKFAMAMSEKMEEMNLGIREVAEKTDLTYEHVRKLVKGMAYPSKLAQKAIAKVLNLSETKVEDLVNADKLQAKFGKSIARAQGFPDWITDWVPILTKLEPQERETLLAMARAMVRQTRQAQG